LAALLVLVDLLEIGVDDLLATRGLGARTRTRAGLRAAIAAGAGLRVALCRLDL